MPWYRWQIERGIASGELPARAELFGARCQWPAWEYIDPAKSAKGNDLDLKNLIKTPQACIRETGREPDEVLDEWEEWNKQVKERGLKSAPPPGPLEGQTTDDGRQTTEGGRQTTEGGAEGSGGKKSGVRQRELWRTQL